MATITKLHARQIRDSRGIPTVEVDIEAIEDVTQEDGITYKKIIEARVAVPSGASTGAHEAYELRDGDMSVDDGKGVLKAVNNINTTIAELLIGKSVDDQRAIDEALIKLDGTPNKSKLGANAVLGASLAVAHARAKSQGQLLCFALGTGLVPHVMPVPMMNVINGGEHATNSIDIQEFMIAPVGASSYTQAIEWGTAVYRHLKKILEDRELSVGLGDEGGFAPDIENPHKVLEILTEAVVAAGLRVGTDIAFALDVAATERFEDGIYTFEGLGQQFTSEQLVDYLEQLCNDFPIISIEDGLAEDDWDGWKLLTQRLGDRIQLVGDDLFVTNMDRLTMGIEQDIANAILIKFNQIGTVTETLDVMELARKNEYACIQSHRSGETADASLTHFAVATNCGQMKTGAPARTDRVEKLNEGVRIEEKLRELGITPVYLGREAFAR